MKRRILRFFAIFALILATLLVSTVLFAVLILYTELGTNFAAQRALNITNTLFPATIKLERIEGSLLDRPVFHQVEIIDADGNPIVRVHRLTLSLGSFPLRNNRIIVQELILEKGEVDLRTRNGSSTFGDLAPAGGEKEEEEEPDDGTPVLLPFHLEIQRMTIIDTAVTDHTGGKQNQIARARRIDLHGQWSVGDADVQIDTLTGTVFDGANTIQVHETAMKASMRNTDTLKASGFVSADRGKIEINNATFRISTLSGRAHVAVDSHTDQWRAYIGDTLKGLPVGLATDIALKENASDLTLEGHLYLGEFTIPLTAGMRFDGAMEAAASFSFDQFSPGSVGLPFAAYLTGAGKMEYRDPAASVALFCRPCSIAGFNDLDIQLNVTRATPTLIQSEVTVSRDDLRIHASGSLTDTRTLDAKFNIKGPLPVELKKLAGLDRMKGVVDLSGRCAGQLSELHCTTDITADNIQINQDRIGTLRGTAAVSLSEGKPFFKTNLALTGVRSNDLVLSTAKISYAGTTESGSIVAEGKEARGNAAKIDARFNRRNDVLTLSVNHVSSTVGGFEIENETPFSIQLDKKGARILDNSLDLKLCGGALKVTGNAFRNQTGKLRAEFTDLNLTCLKKWLPNKEIRGIVTGSLSLSNSLIEPDIILEATGTDIGYLQKSVDSIEIRAAYKDERIHGKVSLQTGEARMSMDASVAMQINLSRQLFEFQTEKESQVHWEVSAVTDRVVSMFMQIPEGLQFSLQSSGKGFWLHGKPTVEGKLSGWVEQKAAGRVPFSVNAEMHSEEQRIRIRATDKAGTPVALTIRSKFDLMAFVSGKTVHSGDFVVDGNLGSAIVTISGSAKSLREAEMALQMRNFKLETLAPYIPGLHLRGTLSAKLSARTKSGEFSADLSGDLSDLISGDLGLGKLTFNSTATNEKIVAALRLKLMNNDVGTVDAEIPIATDLEKFSISWNPDGLHRVRWRLPGLDLGPYRKLLHIPDVLSIQLGTHGELEGNLASIRGSGKLSGTLTISRKEVFPFESEFSLTSQKQTIAVTMQKAGRNIAVVKGTTNADLLALVYKKPGAEVFPIDLKAQVNKLDLRVLNLLKLGAISETSGTGELNMNIAGNTASPVVKGSLKIIKGAFRVPLFERPINELFADVSFSSTRLNINRFEFRIRDGRAAIKGGGADLNLKEGTVKGGLRLSATRLPIEIGSIPGFALTTRTDVKLSLSPDLLDVDLLLNKTEIKSLAQIENKSTTKVPGNPNVIMVDKKEKVDEVDHPFKQIVLDLKTSDPVRVTGPSVDTFWDASLKYTDSEQKGTRIDGTVRSVRGSFELLSNNFILERGELTLASEPTFSAYINLDAEARLAEATVWVNIAGDLQSPNLTLTSDPARSQDQIFALLLTGQSSGDGQATGAMSAMLAMKYPVVRNFMYKRLHIDQFSMGSTAGGGTSIRLGKRITDKSMLFTIFNLNAASDENDLELKMEYALNRMTTLDTSVGDKASGIECLWRIRIDNKAPDEKQTKTEKIEKTEKTEKIKLSDSASEEQTPDP